MRDQRIENLAQILVRYSTKVQKGESVVIGGASSAEPLLLSIYEEVLRAGGNPILQMTAEEAAASFYRLASDEQLDYIAPTTQWVYDNADVVIRVISDDNTRALSNVDPAKQARTQQARKELSDTMMRRSAEGAMRWALTAFPTHGLAGEAGLSLTEYEDFYYKACLATDEDPVTAWARTSAETERLAEWIQGKEEIHITGPGTDVKLNVAGRNWIPCTGKHNMPDGEFFTGPVEDSVEGEVTFSFPAVYGGREVAGVKFRFEGGRVVDASATQGQDFLLEMLDTDTGARTLGELGIGTNYGIATGTREILLDEKIGGTIHMAIGKAYPESGGVNDSAVHWDMVCDLRQGGRITVDGEELQVDGKFVV
ncbi:MAG: aminopeptidase [Thermoleophilaceae bacterium]|nr:aminopeptidase [Thermoleophilaceae bacterium]